MFALRAFLTKLWILIPIGHIDIKNTDTLRYQKQYAIECTTSRSLLIVIVDTLYFYQNTHNSKLTYK